MPINSAGEKEGEIWCALLTGAHSLDQYTASIRLGYTGQEKRGHWLFSADIKCSLER